MDSDTVMPKMQGLWHVCNGGHIHSLDNLDSVEKLMKAMKRETKAILIVGEDQHAAEGLLTSLRKGSKKSKAATIWAKKLCPWSESADLWIVRRVGEE